jgi:hypothetical protein
VLFVLADLAAVNKAAAYGTKLRTDSPPRNALPRNILVWPLKRTLLAAYPMKPTKPEPDAFLQSAQKQ